MHSIKSVNYKTPKNTVRLTYFMQDNHEKNQNKKNKSKNERAQNKIKNEIKEPQTFNKTLKNKGIYSISKLYNDNNNNDMIKSKFFELKNKYNNLGHSYNCFFRIYGKEQSEIIFDPLSHSNLIQKEPFYFKKGTLKLNFDFNNFIINLELNKEKINIKNIQATIINNNIKYLIKIYQRYKHKIEKEKYFDINKFLDSNVFDDIPLNLNKKVMALNNKYYNFSIIIKNNEEPDSTRIEFIIENYENIKNWINALNFLIKIKN